MRNPEIPESLMKSISSDCKPVTPLASAWRRSMPIAAVAASVACIALAIVGLRPDLGSMPPWLSWGGSMLGIATGLILTALALREAVPGRALPSEVIFLAITAGVAIHLAISIMTFVRSSGDAGAGGLSVQGCGCFTHELVFAFPAFAITLWLISRALPTRAGVAGGLGAAGAVIIADSITHLHCPISNMNHVLVWHTGAILTFITAGWLIGRFWEKRSRS